MLFARVVLWTVAAAFAAFGGLFTVWPAAMAALVDLAPTTPTAHTELMAMYGGLELGIAAFLGWCALDAARLRAGLAAAGLLLGGLAALRVAGLAVNAGTAPVMWWFVAIEAAGAGLALAAARGLGRGAA
ncbi:MAG: DUF4345 family protein [Vicinamibacterales bacterium]